MTQEMNDPKSAKRMSLSRRQFLRLSGAAGGTFLFAGLPAVVRVAAQDAPEDVTPAIDSVTFFVSSPLAAPTPRENNSYWQKIESDLGVTIDFQMIPRSDYDQLLGTVLASGDLPDAITGDSRNPIIRRAQQDGAFVRLEDFGLPEETRGYPGLETLPRSSWENSSFNGVVFGVPTAGQAYQDGVFIRMDWLDAVGMDAPTTTDEVMAMLEAFTNSDPDGNGTANTFGFSVGGHPFSDGEAWRLFSWPFGLPQNWAVTDEGGLQHMYTTNNMRDFVAFMAQAYAAGTLNPDFPTLTANDSSGEFASGVTGGFAHNLASGYDLWGAQLRDIVPGAVVYPIDPPTADGYTPTTWLRPGYNTATQIPFYYGDDPERLWQLLRIFDYWFDPATFDFVNFGFEGEHHTVNENGAKVQTEKGVQDIGWIRAWGPRHYLAYVDAPYVQPDTKLQIVEDTNRLSAYGVSDPTWGVFPELGFDDPSAALTEFAENAVGRMVRGEQSMDEWDSFVEEWHTRGGQLLTETMSQQYQAVKGME